MKYAFIRDKREDYSITRMCKVLNVSGSGYYDWLDRPESSRNKTNHRLQTKIRCYHKASYSTYGSPRIHRDLCESGEKVSVNRVAREVLINSSKGVRFIPHLKEGF